MVQFKHFRKLAADYAPIADFILVYVKEAHPTDGWSFKNNPFKIAQHTDLSDRLDAARVIENFNPGCPVLMDSMRNEACGAYNAFPERLYVLKDHMVVLQGGEGPMNYSVAKVEGWLQEYQESSTPSDNNDNNNNIYMKEGGNKDFQSRVDGEKEIELLVTKI